MLKQGDGSRSSVLPRGIKGGYLLRNRKKNKITST